MPKLSKAAAKQVENAEAAAGFAPLPEGRYAAQLRSVTQKDGKEHPYWDWEYHNLHNEDGQAQPGRHVGIEIIEDDAVMHVAGPYAALPRSSPASARSILPTYFQEYSSSSHLVKEDGLLRTASRMSRSYVPGVLLSYLQVWQ